MRVRRIMRVRLAQARLGVVVGAVVLATAITTPAAMFANGARTGELTAIQRAGQTIYYQQRDATPVTPAGHSGTHKADFDGDGIDDIVTVGEIFDGTQNQLDRVLTGVVTIQYSHAGRTDYFIGSEDFDTQAGCCFGGSIATADFNHDGYADLAIGASQEGIKSASKRVVGSGGVWIIYGGPDGLRIDATLSHFNEATSGVPGTAENGDRFGAAVAAGDIDGDGYADLAIGSPGESIGSAKSAGAVTVLYGGSTGISSTRASSFTQNTGGVPGTAENGDSFGSALAVGNTNGDRYADVAVGTDNEATDNPYDVHGMITLLHGSSVGVSFAGVTDVTAGQAAELGSGDGFVLPYFLGKTLAIADVNGDGFGDIISGVPSAEVGDHRNAGAVLCFPGRSSGLSATGRQVITQDTTDVPGVAEGGDGFGGAIAVGDITGDGRPDVLVGSPGESVGSRWAAGAVWIIPGSAHWLTGTGSKAFSQNTAGVPGVAETGDSFGSAVSVLNLTGSGGLDAVIGSSHERTDADQTPYGSGSATSLIAGNGTLGNGTAWSGQSMSTGGYDIIEYGEFGLGSSAFSF